MALVDGNIIGSGARATRQQEASRSLMPAFPKQDTRDGCLIDLKPSRNLNLWQRSADSPDCGDIFTCQFCTLPPSCVLGVSNRLNMIGVDTRTIATQVIELVIRWNWTMGALIKHAMGKLLSAIGGESSIAVNFTTTPIPAAGNDIDRKTLIRGVSVVTRQIGQRLSPNASFAVIRFGCQKGGLSTATRAKADKLLAGIGRLGVHHEPPEFGCHASGCSQQRRGFTLPNYSIRRL